MATATSEDNVEPQASPYHDKSAGRIVCTSELEVLFGEPYAKHAAYVEQYLFAGIFKAATMCILIL